MARHDDAPTEMVTAARRYQSLGWSVIPLRRGDKKPAIAWESFQDRIAAEPEMTAWFARWPEANLGIVTGAVSGLVVLDIDAAHDGLQGLAEIEARHGRLPDTISAETGGGGRHLYFRHPGGIIHNRVGIASGVDLRGDGGYVVAPPSLHPSGRRYAWIAGRAPGQIVLAAAPHWLMEPGRDEGRAGHPIAYWRSLIRNGVGEGERNNSIAALAGRLLWHDVDPEIVTDLLLCWNLERCRPPLSDEEVIATVESITRTHRRHRREAASPSAGS